MKENIKKYLTAENLLCLLIILCPIFDNVSFAFRNYFNTEFSIVTFTRPIIPVIVALYIFIKASKKEKLILSGIALLYLGYGILHLAVTKNLFNKSSYGTIKNETQYIINFTFLIIFLIIYSYIFIKNNKTLETIKIEKSISIMLMLYIVSIYLSIITKTSSYTYIETSTGFKGLIQSGNSISAILLISLFIILPKIKTEEKKYKIIDIVTYILVAIYMVTLLGTRTGLIGIFIVTVIYITLEVIFSRNKKMIIALIAFIIVAAVLMCIFGSTTITRRKQMNEAKNLMIDKSTNEVGNMTIDMLDLKNKILQEDVDENDLPKAQQQSVLDLNEYTKKHNTAGNDLRTQQLMYNIYLVKNQKKPLTIMFGNGYKTNMGEMVMENELASIPLNFGIVGFILYIVPFLAILVLSAIRGLQNIKSVNIRYIMLQCALALSLVLSWMSGYVFFPISSMILVVVASVLLLIEIKKLSKANIKGKEVTA